MTTRPSASKVLLLSAPRTTSGETASAPIRRYRIARLRLDGRQGSRPARPAQVRLG